MSDEDSDDPATRGAATPPSHQIHRLGARRLDAEDAAGADWDLRFFRLYGLDFETAPQARPKRRLVLDRGDSVAVLPFDRARGEVVLVAQERAPLLLRGDAAADGRLIETVAGRVEGSGHGPDDRSAAPEPHSVCAARELAEETRIVLAPDSPRLFPRRSDDPGDPAQFHAAQVGFYASPGGSTEAIWVFLADITDLDHRRASEAGEAGTYERTHVVRRPMASFLRAVEIGAYRDAKILVAAQLLKRLVAEPGGRAEARGAPTRRRLAGADGEIVALPGGLMRWPGALDVVVCPVGVDLMMDPMTRRTLSATLRRNGAHFADAPYAADAPPARADPPRPLSEPDLDRIDPPFDPRDGLRDDTIADALAREGARAADRLGRPPRPGDVLLTTAGALRRRLGLQAIAHLVVADAAAPTRLADLAAALSGIARRRPDAARVGLPLAAAEARAEPAARDALGALQAVFAIEGSPVEQILLLAETCAAAETAAALLAEITVDDSDRKLES